MCARWHRKRNRDEASTNAVALPDVNRRDNYVVGHLVALRLAGRLIKGPHPIVSTFGQSPHSLICRPDRLLGRTRILTDRNQPLTFSSFHLVLHDARVCANRRL